MPILNYSNIIDPLLGKVRVFVTEFTNAKREDRILDVCCGTGDQGFYFAKLNPKINFTGIDINPAMIKIAEKKKAKLSFKNMSFSLEDASKLSFKKDSFDIALTSLSLHEINEELREKIISEMKRVVKKDGFLIFIDFTSPLPKRFSSLFVKSIEYLADKKRFKKYLESGGLPGILKEKNLKTEKICYLMSGLITIAKIKNNK